MSCAILGFGVSSGGNTARFKTKCPYPRARVRRHVSFGCTLLTIIHFIGNKSGSFLRIRDVPPSP